MLSKIFLALAAPALLTSPALATPSQVKISAPTFESGVPTLNWDAPSINRIQPVRPQVASTASWYGVRDGFHGRRTASGEIFDAHGLTAAHPYLPFGTRVRVTNIRNGRSVILRVNDRGPFVGGRVIDVSQGAAVRLGMINSGTAPVSLTVVR
jgi:rare lipoprotein A